VRARIVEGVRRADTPGLEAGTLFRNRHYLLVHLLALALLFAQLGVQAHAYSHLAPDPHGIPNTVQSCGLCVSSAPLLSVVGNPDGLHIAPPCESSSVAPIVTVPIVSGLSCPAFRSRAPPHVL
jgi:hypothetical protein